MHTPRKGSEHMNQQNRRLKEIQQEKQLFQSLLDKSETITDSLTYQGKLDLLEKEETEILQRQGVEL